MARTEDGEFVRSLGADFTTEADLGWDAVAKRRGHAGAWPRRGPRRWHLRGRPAPGHVGRRARDHGRSGRQHPGGRRLAELCARTVSGELRARVCADVPLDDVADAHRAMAKGGVRSRYVLKP